MDFAAAQAERSPWEGMASNAQNTFDDAMQTLQNLGDSGPDSQAELLALQVKFQKASQMFKLASQVMKTAHETRKALIQNLRP
jgi:hypothetical protein